MGILKQYIPRKRLIRISENKVFYDYSKAPKKKYPVNEFNRRYLRRIEELVDKGHLDYVTSSHLGIESVPFIYINTEHYAYGIKDIFYYPVYKFTFFPVLYRFKLHNPVNDTFYYKEWPLGIVVKDYFGRYKVLIGYSAAYFMEGIQRIFPSLVIDPKRLLDIMIPKNRRKWYQRMYEQDYGLLDALKLSKMRKNFG